MLKKSNRLAKTRDVKMAFARGRTFFSPFFNIKFLRRPDLPGPRFTVVVSTKVAKKAVARNRLKRIIRELVRARLHLFSPGDYAIVLKAAAARAGEKELLKNFINLAASSNLTGKEKFNGRLS